jgi:DNA (cytosine-5)-methyltransferase 1
MYSSKTKGGLRMSKPKLLDLCCKAGGMSMGYHLAGFDVTGVDIEPQPHYPFKFIQADATKLDIEFLREFDLLSASPPCQNYSELNARHKRQYPALIEPIREMFIESGRPYVIENVEGAPLINPITLCGSSFGIRVQRHRIFETSFFFLAPLCDHAWQNNDKIFDIYEHGRWFKSGVVRVYGKGGGKGEKYWGEAMGIDWMTRDELAEAIPPAYSKYIGEQFLKS